MQVEIFTLCEFATTGKHDRLTIVNAFTTFFAGDVPARHYLCFIVLRVRFEDADAGVHSFDARIIDNDGQTLTTPMLVEIHARPVEGKPQAWTHLFNLRGLRFQKFGDHWIDLLYDGELTHRIPLSVVPMADAQAD